MPLTFTEIQSSKYRNKAIYVLNKTSERNKGRDKGPVLFSVSDDAGRSIPIRIEDTWLPVNLIEKVLRKQLVNSMEFRQCVNSGLLELISEEEASFIQARPGAQQELKRVSKRMNESSAGSIAMFGSTEESSEEEDEYHPKAVGIGNMVALEGEEGALTTLRGIKKQLTLPDLELILEYAEENTLHRLAKFARSGIRFKSGR